MSEELKQYRVLKPVAISGIVQPGGIVGLTEAEAINIGIGEYLEEVISSQGEIATAEDTETEDASDQDATSEDAGTDTTDESKGDEVV